MIIETIIASLVPVGIEGLKQAAARFFGGVRATTVDEQIKLDSNEIDKIKALKIPPAYQNVTIVNTNKIIAYGYDSKGRKQVIYQPDYVKQRSDDKFNKIFRTSEKTT